MHRLLGVLLLSLFVFPAWADEPVKTETPHHARQTWTQRFADANQAHDGHLTLDEAKAGYPMIAKHFNDIDVDHKGYVTENDLRAWRVMRKAAHRLAQPPEDKLKPRPAFQRHLPDPRQPSSKTTSLSPGSRQA